MRDKKATNYSTMYIWEANKQKYWMKTQTHISEMQQYIISVKYLNSPTYLIIVMKSFLLGTVNKMWRDDLKIISEQVNEGKLNGYWVHMSCNLIWVLRHMNMIQDRLN